MPSLISCLAAPFARLLHGSAVGKPSSAIAACGADQTGQNRGLVLVADGVGGFNLCGISLRHVLAAERSPYAVRLFSWGHGPGRWHADLTDALNRDTKAQLLADTIQSYKTNHPDVPVFLVGKSGGAGVIVKALEHLSDDQVEIAVLLAPALSPAYNLTAALRAVRREIVVFWSPFDVFVLGAGTRVFGTIDRVKSSSAGLVGFRPPAALPAGVLEREQYDKLRQIRWRARMAATGHIGGHFGPDSPAFLRKYVVPLLRAESAARC